MTRLARELLQVAIDLRVLAEWHKPPYVVVRTRSGPWQLAGGAWKVLLMDSQGNIIFGSQWSGGEVVKAHRNGLTHAYQAGRNSDVDVDCDHDKCPTTPRELKP